MTDLFVSYSRADRDRVAPIVAALQAEGLSVWWDTRLRAGDHWDEVIEREIKSLSINNGYGYPDEWGLIV